MKKEKLIEALKKERERFIKWGKPTKDHDLTIEYLETGDYPQDYEDFEILEAAINDFDCICQDYS